MPAGLAGGGDGDLFAALPPVARSLIPLSVSDALDRPDLADKELLSPFLFAATFSPTTSFKFATLPSIRSSDSVQFAVFAAFFTIAVACFHVFPLCLTRKTITITEERCFPKTQFTTTFFDFFNSSSSFFARLRISATVFFTNFFSALNQARLVWEPREDRRHIYFQVFYIRLRRLPTRREQISPFHFRYHHEFSRRTSAVLPR